MKTKYFSIFKPAFSFKTAKNCSFDTAKNGSFKTAKKGSFETAKDGSFETAKNCFYEMAISDFKVGKRNIKWMFYNRNVLQFQQRAICLNEKITQC